MEIRAESRNVGSALLGLAGVACLVMGVLMLGVWEVPLFRFTTFDRDFAGARCGVPLDNPGWRVGSPCHGAVNRQTAAAWTMVAQGVACLMVATGWARQRRRAAVRSAAVAT